MGGLEGPRAPLGLVTQAPRLDAVSLPDGRALAVWSTGPSDWSRGIELGLWEGTSWTTWQMAGEADVLGPGAVDLEAGSDGTVHLVYARPSGTGIAYERWATADLARSEAVPETRAWTDGGEGRVTIRAAVTGASLYTYTRTWYSPHPVWGDDWDTSPRDLARGVVVEVLRKDASLQAGIVRDAASSAAEEPLRTELRLDAGVPIGGASLSFHASRDMKEGLMVPDRARDLATRQQDDALEILVVGRRGWQGGLWYRGREGPLWYEYPVRGDAWLDTDARLQGGALAVGWAHGDPRLGWGTRHMDPDVGVLVGAGASAFSVDRLDPRDRPYAVAAFLPGEFHAGVSGNRRFEATRGAGVWIRLLARGALLGSGTEHFVGADATLVRFRIADVDAGFEASVGGIF